MDFQDLLRDARLGEGSAFAELWARHAGRVASFVRVRGAVEVEEITSDVFVAAFAGIGRFEGDELGFTGLLLTIARRRVVDEQRQRARRVPVAPWQAEDDARSVPSVEDDVLARAGADDLAAHLDRLTPDQREVVTLKLWGGLTFAEIATTLDESINTVSGRYRYALQTLQKRLAPRREELVLEPAPPAVTNVFPFSKPQEALS